MANLESAGLWMLRRLVAVQQDQIRHISELTLKLVEAHFVIRDHFMGLYHKHEALVGLLEDLGVLNREKLQGRIIGHEGGTGFMGVMNTAAPASAVLIGAGQSSLSALCCASRSYLETLVALLVRAPSCDVLDAGDHGDEKQSFQANLFRAAWQPALAIWEASDMQRQAATTHAAAVSEFDPLVRAVKEAVPLSTTKDRSVEEGVVVEEATTSAPSTSPCHPTVPGTQDSMPSQKRDDHSCGSKLEAVDEEVRCKGEALASSAKNLVQQSKTNDSCFREDVSVEAVEAGAYLPSSKPWRPLVPGALDDEAAAHANSASRRRSRDSATDATPSPGAGDRGPWGEAMVEALQRDPAAYAPGDDSSQPLVGEYSGMYLSEDSPRSQCDSAAEAQRGEAAVGSSGSPAARKHPVPCIKGMGSALDAYTIRQKQSAQELMENFIHPKYQFLPRAPPRDSGGNAPLAGDGRGEAAAKVQHADQLATTKQSSAPPLSPAPPVQLQDEPASREEGQGKGQIDERLWQALGDVALKRKLLQALATPSGEVAEHPAQGLGASSEENGAPMRFSLWQSARVPELIAGGFEVVLPHLWEGEGLLSFSALQTCARVSRAFRGQLRTRSASRRQQSPRPKGRRQESQGHQLAGTPQRQQRGSGFTQMLQGRGKVQSPSSPGTPSPGTAQAPRVTVAAAEEEIRRQLQTVATGNRASELNMKINNHIRTGELVQVQGLTRRPDLNGVTGTVLNWIPKIGRWQVSLSTGEQVRLQRENLALMAWTQQLPKVLMLCEAASVLGLKLADFVGKQPVCALKATCTRLRRAARSHLELAIYGGLGSKCTSRRLDAFNPGSNSWKVYPPSHHAHFMGCTAILNGHLYVCGGLDSYATRFVESVEPATCSWEDLPRLRHPRFGAAVAAIAGRLLVLGGVCDEQVLSSMESYLPGENKWEEEPWMEHARCFFHVGVVGGKLIVAGGLREVHQEGFEKAVNCHECHDFVRRAFPNAVENDSDRPSSDANVKYPRQGHTFQEIVELFCPYARRWKDAPSMARLRCQPADVVFRGLYIVCGGFDGREHHRSVEAFDPDINCWRRLASMVSPRVAASASAVEATGSVLVAGGYDSKGVLRTMECLDFDRGHWESILPMTVPRMSPMITVIEDTAFVCGGFNNEGAASKIEGFCMRKRVRARIPHVNAQRPDVMAFGLPS